MLCYCLRIGIVILSLLGVCLCGLRLVLPGIVCRDRLVLLCFDDIRKELCHRSLFAQWWQRETGENVRELQEGCNEQQNMLF